MNFPFKIRIFQPIIPEYRVALFNGLAELYGDRIEIWAAPKVGHDVSQSLTRMKFDYSHPFRRIGPFSWQCGLSLRGLAKGDVVVVCGDLHQLSSLWMAACARLRGIRVVWWGHHKTATSKPLGVRVRLMVARILSDVVLCYTRTGISYLEERGFARGKVFATGNTIDQEPIKRAIEGFDVKDRFEGRPGLLCCSVLREKVHLDLLLKAMSDERLKDVVLAVIGDGPKRRAYEDAAWKYGVADRVRWIGVTRDQMVMAPWFLSAKAFVYPGAVGLSILHAMSYGLPVIVHGNAEHQMPEFEIMEDDKTGLCFDENDERSLADTIVRLLADEHKRMEMSRYSQKVAFEQYSMDQMIANFASAIEGAAKED